MRPTRAAKPRTAKLVASRSRDAGRPRRSRASQVRDHAQRDRPAHVPLARQSAAGRQQPGDDQQEVDVEIVDRKTKVLLVASGPTREYTFLRNQLQRDKRPWSTSGCNRPRPKACRRTRIKLLTEFPATPQELFEYDAIVAFDPDWEELERRRRSTCSSAGSPKRPAGLIVMAGPVADRPLGAGPEDWPRSAGSTRWSSTAGFR